MAAWFFCSVCETRFPLPPEKSETQENYMRRIQITAREFCPKCGGVCDPCVCRRGDNSDSLRYNPIVPTGARRIG